MPVNKSTLIKEREKLAKLLRELRTEAGLRQIDLAEKLGEPQSYVSKYESGEQRLDIIEVRTICKAFGLTLAEFVERFERQI
jgi:transcriptional regulator with XRE-family HTH domain